MMKFLTAFLLTTLLCTFAVAQEEIPAYVSSLQQSQKEQSNLINEQTATLEELTAKVQELKNQLDEIKTALKNKENNRKKEAQDSYLKAEQLRQQKQYQNAGIYYSNALAAEPDNITILNAYTNTVLEWVASRQTMGDYASAQNTLNDYIRYLYTYPAGLPIKGADYLSRTFWTLTEFQNKLAQEAASRKREQELAERNELEKTIQLSLSKPLADNEEDLLEQFHELQNLSIKWQKLAPGEFRTANDISQKQGLLVDNMEALSLLSRGEKNLSVSAKATADILDTYTANELYLTNQRLDNLKPSLTDKTLTRANKFKADLNNLAGNISTGSAKTTWDNLNIKRRNMVETEAKKARTKEEAIRIWTMFAEDVNMELMRTQNIEYAVNMRRLFLEINQRISVLREEQLHLYEKWGLKNIKTMHEDYNREVGILSGGRAAKERIAAGMKDYLCPVDTRYLSVTSLKLYNDVYDFFNKELDRDMRINTAIQFNDCLKKSITDF